MSGFAPVTINDRWTLELPAHRVDALPWSVWERERIASMHQHLRPSDVIVDVGAEEGDLPALWASWGCRVVLVEPDPKVWPNMRAIWQANRLEAPLACFVGFASDVTDPGFTHDATLNPAVATGGGWPPSAFGPVTDAHAFRHLSQQADSTPQVTLDDLCDPLHVDAITIDVEGSELRVLRGARDLLLGDRPLVWVSCHLDERWMIEEYGGTTSDDVSVFMAECGYRGELLAVDHEMHMKFTPEERA